MSVWDLLEHVRVCPLKRAERVIRDALVGWPHPVVGLDNGLRAVVAPPRSTYRSRVYVWAYEDSIRCQAATDITIARDWIGRELALQLLEANQPDLPGVFSLVPHGDERIVVLGTEVDARDTTPAQLRTLIGQLLDRFERMVVRLYAMNLILAGPEPYTPEQAKQ